MRMRLTAILLPILLSSCMDTTPRSTHEIHSPDGDITVTVELADQLRFMVQHKGQEVVRQCDIALLVEGVGTLGNRPSLVDSQVTNHKEILTPVVRVKSAEIPNNYNELRLVFEGGYSVEFRVFDEGLAYRFCTALQGSINITNELIDMEFAASIGTFFNADKSFLTAHENGYQRLKLETISPRRMCGLPVVVEVNEGLKVAVTEADLFDYPGLYLHGNRDLSLSSIFPAVAVGKDQTTNNALDIVRRMPYIARTDGERSFPWRVFVLAEDDSELIENQMVYALSRPLEIEDTSWIHPGKAAWDWWNDNNIYGVDFHAGINTETYMYFIDFASKYGIEYIIFDEGWYKNGDLHSINPDVDLPKLLAYAKSKNVGVILWVIWKTLENQMEMLDVFEQWGVAGIKLDSLMRDDQWMVNYYWKIAREAAKRKMLVNFHGSYKPCGIRRAYPNVITREGLRGLEGNKWSEMPSAEHNTILPFTRMLAGPMDYTPGAMINAQKEYFRAIRKQPMSMTTRCHQLALYVIFESPLQMLADSPSHYLEEPECMEFLSAVPTVWDETRVLAAKVSDYVILARRNGDDWYVGAIGDEEAREFNINLSFLGDGEWTMLEYRDGINADRRASDFIYEKKAVSAETALKIKLAPAGGWVARFVKK